jgi:hypothetical protein
VNDMKDRTATPSGDRLEDGAATAPPICRRLFAIDQAADAADVPVQQIWHWIRIGKLKAYHLGGGRLRIDECDLIANITPRELKW